MLRLAVISDIHGNLPALKVVLEDVKLFKADGIYCLGDLTDGAPWNNEVIDLIRELGIPCIMGNHDERIAFDLPVFALKKHSIEEQEARLSTINHTKLTITASNKEYLASLSPSIRLNIDGLSILLVHGSPASNEEYIYEDHDPEKMKEFFSKYEADLIVGGHTHLSFIRTFSGQGLEKSKMWINTGSVGRTKEGDGKASYLQLILDKETSTMIQSPVDAMIRKISYPIQETLEGIRNSSVPNFYADFLENN